MDSIPSETECSRTSKTNENLKRMIEYMRKGDAEHSFAILKADHFEIGRDSALKAKRI